MELFCVHCSADILDFALVMVPCCVHCDCQTGLNLKNFFLGFFESSYLHQNCWHQRTALAMHTGYYRDLYHTWSVRICLNLILMSAWHVCSLLEASEYLFQQVHEVSALQSCSSHFWNVRMLYLCKFILFKFLQKHFQINVHWTCLFWHSEAPVSFVAHSLETFYIYGLKWHALSYVEL
jgi:hypothetical protein